MAKKEYKSVSEHLGQFSSKTTKKTYLSGIGGFFRTINPKVKDLDSYSLSYLKSHTQGQIENDIEKFRDILLTKTAKTRNVYLQAVFGFFDSNNVAFKKNWKSNILGKDNTAVSEERVPTPQELERILNFLPLIGKAMTLCLCSSGMRIGELLLLKESNVDLTQNPVIVTLPSQNTKSKKKRITFISQEAKKMLQEWLEYKPQWLKTTSNKTDTPFNTNLLFLISEKGYRELWNGALKKANLGKKDETTNRIELRIHALRKYFRTYGRWTQPDIAESLMGHLGSLEQIYARFSEDQLREAYLTAEPNLTILGSAPNLKELQEQMQEQYKGVDRIIANLSIKNQELENALQKKDTDFKQKFTEIEEQLQGQDLLIKDMRERMSNFINENVRMDEWYAELRKKEAELEEKEKEA